MKKMSKSVLMTALITGTVLVGGTSVFAEEAVAAEEPAVQEYSMDEMVVTASRVQTKKVDTPANVAVVDAEKIESRRYQNVAEALRDVPGVNVLDNGYGTNEKTIIINGDERVLVLVDGRRVNYDIGGQNGRSSYDPNQLPDVALIDRIEVVKGHGGALYGSDAVGGVVNIITKKMDYNYGKVSMAFGSNQAREGKAMYSIKEGKTGVMVSAAKGKQGYYKYKDARNGEHKHWPADTSYDNEKVSFKINQELTKGQNIEFGYDFSKLEGSSPGSIGYAVNNHMDKKTNNFYLKYDWGQNTTNDGYVTIYRNNYKYYNYGGMENTAVGIDAQQAIATSDTNKLIVGASYRRSKANSNSFDSDTGTTTSNYESQSINNKAVFAEDIWEFAPTWTLNAGVRYDHHSKAGSKTTLSAGLNKKFDENSHAYFNWGQVYKAPTIDDLYYNYYNANYWYGMYGNSNLKPEKGDTWTVGYSTKLSESTDVTISYFQSRLKNAIEWVPDATYSYYATNIDRQKKRGFELSVNHNFNENFDAEFSYTYVRVRNNEKDGQGYVRDDKYVPNIYRAGLRYHNNLWNIDWFLRAGSGASADQYVDGNYITMDMAASYRAAKNWTIFAKGYNLFNKAYAERGGLTYSGEQNYPAQGRHFLIGAEYTF